MANKMNTADAIRKLYERIYNDDYEKRIFDCDIEAAMQIILSDKQTGITPAEFIKAIKMALKTGKGSTFSTGTIDVDFENCTVIMQSLQDCPKHFIIKLLLNKESLKIDNYCEVKYKESKILCSIPEQFSKDGSIKDEVSEFILPSHLHNLPSPLDQILYTTAESSVCRAIGKERLTEEDIELLKEGEKLVGGNGVAYYDGKMLVIANSTDKVKTLKSYRPDSIFGSRVVYNKYEEVKLEKTEFEDE